MDENDRLNLKKMVKEYDSEETTGKIRELKHSTRIRQDMRNFVELHRKYNRIYKSNFKQFKLMAEKRCNFLYTNYTNIYNKLLKNALDYTILNEFLNMLERIENNEMDQHEASYNVGMLLKKLYVDSALREEKMHDKKSKSKSKSKSKGKGKNISWNEYKKTQLNNE